MKKGHRGTEHKTPAPPRASPRSPMPACPSHTWLRLQLPMRLFSGCCSSPGSCSCLDEPFSPVCLSTSSSVPSSGFCSVSGCPLGSSPGPHLPRRLLDMLGASQQGRIPACPGQTLSLSYPSTLFPMGDSFLLRAAASLRSATSTSHQQMLTFVPSHQKRRSDPSGLLPQPRNCPEKQQLSISGSYPSPSCCSWAEFSSPPVPIASPHSAHNAAGTAISLPRSETGALRRQISG